MVAQRYHDRFFRLYGFIVSAVYALWIIMGLSFGWPYWAVFVIPLPAMLLIYLIWNFINHMKNPQKSKEPSIDYIDEPL
ncbi:MAG: hypothetical protein HZR80_10350 [Candidatus Heimdallarchaeota archaeon]